MEIAATIARYRQCTSENEFSEQVQCSQILCRRNPMCTDVGFRQNSGGLVSQWSTEDSKIGNFHSTCYQSLRSATLFLYALHNVTMTMPLENRMRTPHNLQRMLILNVSFNVFIVHDIRVPRLQQMHARCLRHCSQESSQESVDVPLTQTVKTTIGCYLLVWNSLFITNFNNIAQDPRKIWQNN